MTAPSVHFTRRSKALVNWRRRSVKTSRQNSRKTRASRIEAEFAFYWRSLGGPELKRDFAFHPECKWRTNFADVEIRTLIEIEGGIFPNGGGRHNRAAGFIADADKDFHAWLNGWSVVRLAASQITAENIERIIQKVRSIATC